MNIRRSTLLGTAIAFALSRPARIAPRHASATAEDSRKSSSPASAPASRSRSTPSATPTRASRSSPPKTSARCRRKNVADSLQRLPGVNISSASANEGGFDENDRVSMRGTNPSLTQTLINGHSVGAGDWFVLSQVQQVGRSVSYTLLPSELVSQIVVHKSSQASLAEGGIAGSVDIITRKPLEFAEPVTFEARSAACMPSRPDRTIRSCRVCSTGRTTTAPSA